MFKVIEMDWLLAFVIGLVIILIIAIVVVIYFAVTQHWSLLYCVLCGIGLFISAVFIYGINNHRNDIKVDEEHRNNILILGQPEGEVNPDKPPRRRRVNETPEGYSVLKYVQAEYGRV